MNQQINFLILFHPFIAKLGSQWIDFVQQYPEAAKKLHDDCAGAIGEMTAALKEMQQAQRRESLDRRLQPLETELQRLLASVGEGGTVPGNTLTFLLEQLRSLKWDL